MKHDPMPREMRGTINGAINDYMGQVVGIMFNDRISEITQKPDAPFIAGAIFDGDFFVSKTKDAFTPPDNSEDVKEQNKDSETFSKPDIRGVSDKNIDNEKEKLNQEIKVEKVDSTKIKQQETQVSSQAASLKDYVAEVSIKLNENWQPPKSGQNTQTIVILTIGEDGSLQKYDIAKSSGDEATDRSIISAAEKSVPYAKFSGIKKGVNNIKLQFVFEYKKFKKSVM